MAYFEIDAERIQSADAWPDRCARCGDSGTELVPVPRRHAKKTDDFSVPLCPKHRNDWSDVGFRTRIGALLVLLYLPLGGFFAWLIQPHVSRPNEQNNFSRYTFAVCFGLMSSLAVGALLALWTKTPIRVLSVTGRFVMIAGVCRRFARGMSTPSEEPKLPAVSEDACFDVNPYQPKPTLSTSRAGNALAILFVLAAALGAAIGLGGLEIEKQAAGWDKNDWRYIPMTIGVVLAFVLPLTSPRLLFSRFGIFLAIALSIPVLIGLGVACLVASLRMGFSLAYTGCPLILLQFLSQRLIWRWKLRSTPVAVAAGTGSTLAMVAFAFLLGGRELGPHLPMFAIGPLFAIFAAVMSRAAATAPFCSECDDWLIERRIGALPKSLADVQPLIAGGQVIALANVKPYEKSASIGDVELKVFTCEQCREAGTLVLELTDCQKGGKNGKQPVLKRIGRWEYPGAALPAIEAMFPPPQEVPAAQPAETA